MALLFITVFHINYWNLYEVYIGQTSKIYLMYSLLGVAFHYNPPGGCMRGFKVNYNNSKTWQNKLGVKKSSSCMAQQKFCANHIPYAF